MCELYPARAHKTAAFVCVARHRSAARQGQPGHPFLSLIRDFRQDSQRTAQLIVIRGAVAARAQQLSGGTGHAVGPRLNCRSPALHSPALTSAAALLHAATRNASAATARPCPTISPSQPKAILASSRLSEHTHTQLPPSARSQERRRGVSCQSGPRLWIARASARWKRRSATLPSPCFVHAAAALVHSHRRISVHPQQQQQQQAAPCGGTPH